MGDNENSLDIDINLRANTAAATQATTALDQTTAAAKKLQAVFESTKGMGAPPPLPGSSPKDVENTAKTAEHLGKIVGHGHEMHRLFHGLNEELPGLGSLMQLAFSPIGGSISLFLIALRQIHEHFAKVNEELDKLRGEQAKPTTHVLEAQRQAFIDAGVAAGAFHDRLADAARGERGFKEEIVDAAAAIKNQLTAAGQAADALKGRGLAELEFAHKIGLVNDDQYYKAKLTLEENYAERKRALEEKIAAAELQVHRDTFKTAKAMQPGLQAAAEAAAKRTEKARIKLAGLPDEEEVKTNKAVADKALQDFTTQHGKSTNFFTRLGVNLTSQQAYEVIANAAFPGGGQGGLRLWRGKCQSSERRLRAVGRSQDQGGPGGLRIPPAAQGGSQAAKRARPGRTRPGTRGAEGRGE